MENTPGVLRYAAFSTTPNGGNPAGLVLDAGHLDDAGMLAVAAAVGYAETAFVTEQGVDGDPRRSRVRYFSPIAEVPFCGHATIALAVALSERDGAGSFTFDTPPDRSQRNRKGCGRRRPAPDASFPNTRSAADRPDRDRPARRRAVRGVQPGQRRRMRPAVAQRR
ncbi:PhzF family phenazine biosynthesis protein [Pseudarthrobacter albicanus]|uniref:PhzF family phenazine biosynthesis protein n=1 Tax=Pseudarthrobacter albicanus TaxID=2823873 RepID=UPI0027DC53B2|nr:PhzF family phenazine biosynthesis protein [Pseudarthrobacter albicanus]